MAKASWGLFSWLVGEEGGVEVLAYIVAGIAVEPDGNARVCHGVKFV